ncbi:MAG TPA: hypothetical protein VEX38_07155 [Fimbriimonadaceae bacterium]|nr:hypothetical protein [Fimbriimonadaceae bacterium]
MRIVFALALLLVLSGCKPGPRKTDAPSFAEAILPTGWSRVSSPDYGFSLGIPPGWSWKDMKGALDRIPDPKGDGRSLQLDLLSNLASWMSSSRSRGFVAVAPEEGSGAVHLLLAHSEPYQKEPTLEKEAQRLSSEYGKHPHLRITNPPRLVEVPAGKAVYAEGGLDGAAFGVENVRVTAKHYVLLNENTRYSLVFFSSIGTGGEPVKTKEISETLRYLPGKR